MRLSNQKGRTQAVDLGDRRRERPRAEEWRRFTGNRLAVFGSIIVACLLVLALFPRLIMPHDPTRAFLADARTPPGGRFILGTDELGRDILSRMIAATRVAFIVALSSVFIGLFLGMFFGLVAGYTGGIVETLIMRLMDIMLAFPYLLLAIAIVAVLGTSTTNTILALAFYSTPTFSRLVRSSVLSIREKDYVESAVALGSSGTRILLRHVMPNLMSPIIVYATLFTANAIRMEAGLSFLGLGVQPPLPSWGSMIAGGRDFLRSSPHIATIPGIGIMLSVLGFNLLGDGLRDALDPRMRVERKI